MAREMACARLLVPKRRKMFWMWFFTVHWLQSSTSVISEFVLPSFINNRISCCRRVTTRVSPSRPAETHWVPGNQRIAGWFSNAARRIDRQRTLDRVCRGVGNRLRRLRCQVPTACACRVSGNVAAALQLLCICRAAIKPRPPGSKFKTPVYPPVPGAALRLTPLHAVGRTGDRGGVQQPDHRSGFPSIHGMTRAPSRPGPAA